METNNEEVTVIKLPLATILLTPICVVTAAVLVYSFVDAASKTLQALYG